jgi:hypothetical protein
LSKSTFLLLRVIDKKGIGLLLRVLQATGLVKLAINCERFLSTNWPRLVQCFKRLRENEFFRDDQVLSDVGLRVARI